MVSASTISEAEKGYNWTVLGFTAISIVVRSEVQSDAPSPYNITTSLCQNKAL